MHEASAPIRGDDAGHSPRFDGPHSLAGRRGFSSFLGVIERSIPTKRTSLS
jgi:hypothetical protein